MFGRTIRDVKIMQGVSGAGKSTFVRSYLARDGRTSVCSADDFFGPEYKFDPRKLPQAHQACLRTFIDDLRNQPSGLIVVDNTNTTVAEVAPYYAAAEAYGWEPEIVYLHCEDIEVAIARNVHKVPEQAIRAMADRLSRFTDTMPPWWNRSVGNALSEPV